MKFVIDILAFSNLFMLTDQSPPESKYCFQSYNWKAYVKIQQKLLKIKDINKCV